MSDVFFLILRRLRTPLILLILVYGIATIGMTLIPGVDPNGEPWRMSFFQAFYFVSFMGTTIGFGEIPYAFTDSQRAWVLFCIYTSVITWLYGIGTLLRLVQDQTFQSALAQQLFRRSIKRINRPFYMVCGYGETGMLITRGLAELGLQSVVVDLKQERTNLIELEALHVPAITFNVDISEPANLIDAGINSGWCKGVIAVTQNDHTNLKIAVAAKLVNPQVKVICRSENEDEAKNMASFGTDVIINPYLTFGRRLKLLTQNHSLYQVHNWFINQHSAEHINDRLHSDGLSSRKWIVCGYGRFGKAIIRYLGDTNQSTVIVDPDPIKSEAPSGTVRGRGTEADTLIEAGILDADVVVAASDDDANNLSVLITAKQLNKSITTIGRVSREADHSLFVHADCDYIFRRAQVVANEALTLISRPLVTKFLQHSTRLDEQQTLSLIDDIRRASPGRNPVTNRIHLSEEEAPALVQYLQAGNLLRISDLCSHPRLDNVNNIPLLLLRDDMSHVLPDTALELRYDDELLFCGHRDKDFLAQLLSHDIELVDSLINNNTHTIPFLRWLTRKRTR